MSDKKPNLKSLLPAGYLTALAGAPITAQVIQSAKDQEEAQGLVSRSSGQHTKHTQHNHSHNHQHAQHMRDKLK